MLPSSLAIFTSNYPFGSGEEFLETEIEYLAGHFKKIYIFSAGYKNKVTRKIPSNCVLLEQPSPSGFFSIVHPRSWLSSDLFWDFLFSSIKRPFLSTPRRLFHALKYRSNGLRLKKEIDKLVALHPPLNSDPLFLYSYWFNHCAFAISEFRKSHKHSVGFTRAHGIDLYMERSSVDYLPLRKSIARNLNAVFFISNHGKNYFRSFFGEPCPLMLSRLGTKNTTVKNQGSSDGVCRLLVCAHLSCVKRIDLLVEALSQIIKTKFHCTIIGDGPEKTSLETLSKNLLSPKKNITYDFSGRLSNHKIYEYYEHNPVDAIVNLSDFEGIPVSIMEAMSFGVPVIARPVGGIPELVGDKAGILLGPDPSVKDISSAIQSFARLSHGDLKRLRKGAFSQWKDGFSAELNYNEFIEQLTPMAKV